MKSIEMEIGPIGFLIAQLFVHVVFYLLPNIVWIAICFVLRQLYLFVIEMMSNALPHVHIRTNVQNNDNSTKQEEISQKVMETLIKECKMDKQRVCILASAIGTCHHESNDDNGDVQGIKNDQLFIECVKNNNNNKKCQKCFLSTYEMFGISKEWVTNVNDVKIDSSERSEVKNVNTNDNDGTRNGKDKKEECMYNQAPYLHYRNPLYNAHIHTIFGAIRPSGLVSMERQTIASYDGGLMCLDWVINKPTKPKSKNALVFIVPGITGSSSENYVQRMAYYLIQDNRKKFSDAFNIHKATGNIHHDDDVNDDDDVNVSAVFYTARGLGDTPLTTPQMFCANYTDDVRYIMHHIFTPSFLCAKLHLQESCSSTIPIIGIGFSMGGTVLSHYVSEESIRDRVACMGDKAQECDIMSLPAKDVHSPLAPLPSKFDAIITICSPCDAFVAHNQLMTPLVKHTYNKYLTKNLHAFFERHAPVSYKMRNVDCKRVFAVSSDDDTKVADKLHEKEEVEHTTITSNGKNKNGMSEKENESAEESKQMEYKKEPLISTLKTIWDFDNAITAPHFKYKDAVDYYTHANVFRKIVYCDVPQISLVSRDDCVIGYAPDSFKIWTDVIRTRDKFNKIANVDSKFTNNHSIIYVEMPCGGHMGFLQSPLQEYHGNPNDMEVFVTNSVYAFIHNWYRTYS